MFYERVKELCEEHNTSITVLLKSLGISISKSTAWKYGSMPRSDVIKIIADHFNVSTDYILGNTDDKKKYGSPEETVLDSKKRRELDLLKKIDPELLPEVVKFAQYLQSQRDE